MDVIAVGLQVGAHSAASNGLVLPSDATDGKYARRQEKLEKGASLFSGHAG
jgi:hypothetical protein